MCKETAREEITDYGELQRLFLQRFWKEDIQWKVQEKIEIGNIYLVKRC